MADSSRSLRDAEVVALLTAEAGADPLEPIALLSRILNPESVRIIDATARQAVMRGDGNAADSMLLKTERAAEIVGDDLIRAWARLGRGLVAVGRKNPSRALALIPKALEQLDAVAAPLENVFLSAYMEGADWVCERLLGEQRLPEAREQFARMLRHAHSSGASGFEARNLLNLLQLSLVAGDLRAVEAHALTLVRGLWGSLLEAEDARTATIELIRSATFSLYGKRMYSTARELGRKLVAQGGDDGELIFALATAAYLQKDSADALTWIDRLLQAPEQLLPEYDVTLLHQRRAVCLSRLERPAEALDAIQRAVSISPGDPYLRFTAAELFRSVGDLTHSIEEYSTTVALVSSQMASPEFQPRESRPRSSAEYEMSTPVEDLREFALIWLAKLMRATGDLAAANDALEQLLAVGDGISQSSALLTLAAWAEEANRQTEAVAFLERALLLRSRRQPEEVPFRLAPLLIDLGNYQRAIEVITPYCHWNRAPKRCIEILDRIPRTWTSYRLVLKRRGYAKTEAGWPSEGFAELSEAVAADATDAESLVMRALARLSLGNQEGQQAWNASRSVQHIQESVKDLYAALELRPHDEEILRILKWLVERAASDPMMYAIFSADADLFAAFPNLESAFELSWRANDLAAQQRFGEAAQLWLEAQAAHDAAGFTILSGRVSLRLADVFIRLLDLGSAASHLTRAEQLRFLVNVPLSLDVLAEYEQKVATRGRFEEPVLCREARYDWIYDCTVYDFMRLQFVTASYRHRVGDLPGALQCVDSLAPLLKNLTSTIGRGFGVEEVLWVIAILRDAKRHDDALRLLDALQTLPEAQPRAFQLLYMRGLMYDAKADSQRALEAYEQALSVAAATGAAIGMLPYLQYAASLLNVRRAADALSVLQQVDPERGAIAECDWLYYHTAAAWIYAANGRLRDAAAAVEQAIPMVERARAGIHDGQGRREWQGQQHNLFSIAVRVHVESGNLRRAWEIMELSRARTLLDDLSVREGASFETPGGIAELDIIEQALYLIDRDMADSRLATGESTGAETMASLAALLSQGFQDVIASVPFLEGDLPAMRKTLVERRVLAQARERAAREAATPPSAAVVPLPDVQALLREEDPKWR